MDGTARRRIGALLASATLLASLTLVAVVATTSAAPPDCRGETATIVGTDEGEVIVGTDGADVIVALGGDDTVRSLEGADIVCAGAGTDSVHGGTGRDALEGGNAADTLIGGKGRDRLRGNAGDDDLDGGLHRDTCFVGPDGGTRVDCENPLPAPTPAPTPAPQAPKPTPVPDSDGDGFTDDVDKCLSKGDQGYGLDGTGCPNPPPPTFWSVCEDYNGTFNATGSNNLVPTCEWTGVDVSVLLAATDPLRAFCPDPPGHSAAFNDPESDGPGDAYVGCLRPR